MNYNNYFLLVENSIKVKSQKNDFSKKIINTAVNNVKKHNNLLPQKKQDMIVFMKKLELARDSESLSQLVDESMNTDILSHELMMYLTIKKWGRIAPLQCLTKLKSNELLEYVHPLFSSWAERNPEAAISFYEANYMGRRENFIPKALSAIIEEYSKINLEKTASWLKYHENDLSLEELKNGKKSLLRTVSEKDPKLLSQYLSLVDQKELKKMSYELGYNWGNYTNEPGEWINNLPEECKAKAEAGRIMGLSKGDLEKINDQILNRPLDDIVNISKELAPFVFYNVGGSITDRVNWIINTLPETAISTELKSSFSIWMREDRKNAREWLDTLPEGDKKAMLEELYKKNKPIIKKIDSRLLERRQS